MGIESELRLVSNTLGSPVLLRPRPLLPQLIGGAQGPIRIAQQFARQKHHVRLPCADDLIRLRWRGKHSYRGGENARFLANPLRERHLITGAGKDRSIWHSATRRTID